MTPRTRFTFAVLGLLAHNALGVSSGCDSPQSCQAQEAATNLLQTKLKLEGQQEGDGLHEVPTGAESPKLKSREGLFVSTKRHHHRQRKAHGARQNERNATSAQQDSSSSDSLDICNPPTEDTFVRLLADEQVFYVELTSALASGSAYIMVTAMSKTGLYLDGYGFGAAYAYPMEDLEHTMLELRLNKDGTAVDVYRPELDLRTTDEQTKLALAKGVGDGWIDSLPLVSCGDSAFNDQQIIVDGNIFLQNGFYIVDPSHLGLPQRVRSGKFFAHNFDVTVDYAFEDGFRQAHLGEPVQTLGFSVVQLSKTPMATRGNDDRVLFFDTKYNDKGYKEKPQPWKKPSQSVDQDVRVIWRHNLPALPHGIRIYVDPSVPERWRSYFKEGIEAWNAAFKLAGYANAVKGILPTDADWPKDYDIADARFHTVSWDFTPSTTSMGVAKVDPRSGEIIKSDIIMADTWVSAYLQELERETVNFTYTALDTMGKVEDSQKAWWLRGADRTPAGKKSNRQQKDVRHDEMHHRQAKSFGFAAAVLSKPLSNAEIEKLMGAGLRDVVMHEVGHILGLRHNFKGTLAISKECLQDKACTREKGLSSSVMDYVPLNLPPKNGKEVDMFSSVVGAWDKLAIRYGYTDFEQEGKSHLSEILEDAGQIESCYDDDESMSDDPSCLAYDMRSDPVGYIEDMLRHHYGEVLKSLLDISVTPGESYIQFGQALTSTLSLILGLGSDAILYLGGINNSYVHRTPWESKDLGARRPINVSWQQQALRIVTNLFRPQEHGLWPHDELLKYMVEGDEGEGAVDSLDLPYIYESFTGQLISGALSAARCEQVVKQEKLLSKGSAEVLRLDDYLSTVVQSLTREGFDVASSAEEKYLQKQLVRALSDVLGTETSTSSPDLIMQVEYQLRYLGAMAMAALEKMQQSRGEPALWHHCAAMDEECACRGVVRLGGSGTWSASVASMSKTLCSLETFNSTNAAAETWSCQCLSSSQDPDDLHQIHVERLLADVEAAVGKIASTESVKGGAAALGASGASLALALAALITG